MGAPLGNKNGSKQKRIVSDCVRRELTQRPEDTLAIVNRAITDAKNGDANARAWLAERCDGKAPQPIVGDDDEDPIRTVSKIELVNLSSDSAPAET
jgi:hypothetical protein